MAARRATCCPAPTTTCRRGSVRGRIPSRSRPTAARSGVHRDHGCRRSDQHERRSLRSAGRWRRGQEAHDQPWVRRRAGVLAGWPVARLPLAAARRLRGGQVAADGAGPGVGPFDEPDGHVGPQRREPGAGRATAGRSTSTPRIAARCRYFRLPRPAATPRAITAGGVRRRVQPRPEADTLVVRAAAWRRLPNCS